MRRWYGSSPLHLVVVTAALALGLAAALPVLGSPQAVRIGLWFLGAVLLHDLVLFPLYAAADRALPRGAVNHVRVPALLSGLLLLMFWPMITQHSEASYNYATSLDQDVYPVRYLLLTAGLFGASALLYVVRAVRRR